MMLNITNHQGNANQTTMKYHIIPVRMDIIKREEVIISVGEVVEKVKSCALYKLYSNNGQWYGVSLK